MFGKSFASNDKSKSLAMANVNEPLTLQCSHVIVYSCDFVYTVN